MPIRTVRSTPTARAIFKGWSSRSVVQTSSAPAAFAAPAARIPIGPDPPTRTFAPATPPALFRACSPTANGSASTARESGRVSGSTRIWSWRTSMYSEKPPCVCGKLAAEPK